MSRITFNIAAKCDKAGRTQNQDNYWVCPNLDNIQDTSAIGNDADVELSTKGALMVVADGMGGMKSGEKASEFVIDGIKAKFRNIPESILNDDNAITSFIREAIIQADESIKEYAKIHRESEGMGSTIVLLWMLGDKAYCGWCGDSRIYCYNPQNTLVRLSHDHSYVQSLVDEGKITEDEAFDHPDGNIITRSLGDSGEKANPETKIYPIHRRDVFLLCSDGLCGLVNDAKIDSILADNCTSSKDALVALWKEGEKEGWSDNATIEVACVTEGGATPNRKATGYDEGRPKPVVKPKDNKDGKVKKDTDVLPNFWQNNKNYILIIAIVAIVSISVVWYFSREKKQTNGSVNQEYVIPSEETGNQGSTDQDGSNQGSNNQGGGNQGGNHQGGNNQGGNSQGGNNQGGNNQGGNNQGGNNQGGNNQGGNNQGGNNQGGNDHISNGGEPSRDYINNLINPTREEYGTAKSIMDAARRNRGLSENAMQQLGNAANNVKNNLVEITSNSLDYNKLSPEVKQEIQNWKKLEIEVRGFQQEFKPRPAHLPFDPGRGRGTDDDTNTSNGQQTHQV